MTSKPATTAPRILSTYISAGTRMYRTDKGLYDADLYDKAFQVVKSSPLPRKGFTSGMVPMPKKLKTKGR